MLVKVPIAYEIQSFAAILGSKSEEICLTVTLDSSLQ